LPRPGQYIQAHNPNDPDAVLGTSLFPIGLPTSIDGSSNFESVSLGPIPYTWNPGTTLELRGPLGHGFVLPPAVNSLGLIALGDMVGRLLPLVPEALSQNTDVAIFSDAPLPPLPPVIEIRSLNAIPEAAAWADYLALDLSLDDLPNLRNTFELQPYEFLSCPAQALISTPMPCAGIGDCGICSVPKHRKSFLLACKDGPVFNLNQLNW
jgi:dihydroorotate dehydrogenase electron transfer subunit